MVLEKLRIVSRISLLKLSEYTLVREEKKKETRLKLSQDVSKLGM